jgi:hypothetical protein
VTTSGVSGAEENYLGFFSFHIGPEKWLLNLHLSVVSIVYRVSIARACGLEVTRDNYFPYRNYQDLLYSTIFLHFNWGTRHRIQSTSLLLFPTPLYGLFILLIMVCAQYSILIKLDVNTAI